DLSDGFTDTPTSYNKASDLAKGEPGEAPTSPALDQGVVTSMAGRSVPLPHDSGAVCALLDSPEIATLIADLDATRWTGRPGYPMRAMVGMALVKAIYNIPVWTRVVRLVAEH